MTMPNDFKAIGSGATHLNIYQRAMLLAALFVSGGVVMALEILGARVIHPFFGVTLYVWAAMIAVTLLSLAVGYALGGWLADSFPRPNWLFSVLMLTGIWVVFIPCAAPWIMRWVSDWELRLGVLSASMILFSWPLMGLGVVSPYGIRLLLSRVEKSGMTAGGLYAVSTAGSLAGTLLTGFYLISHFAVSQIFLMLAGALFLAALFGFVFQHAFKTSFFWMAAVALVAILLIFVIHPKKGQAGETQIIYQTESVYGQIKVVDHRDLHALLINGSPQSYFIRREDPYDFFHRYEYESYFASVLAKRPALKKILVVGLGAGRLPVFFSNHGVVADVVEIDPEVKEVAEKYFNFRLENGNIYLEDGRPFIRKLGARGEHYGAILLDAFASYDLPEHFFTLEMFWEVKNGLESDGVLGINIGGILVGSAARVPKAIFQTLKRSFLYVEAFSFNANQKADNIVFFASDAPLDWNAKCRIDPCADQKALVRAMDSRRIEKYLSTGEILSDDYNPLSIWSVPVYREYREKVLGYFGKNILSQMETHHDETSENNFKGFLRS